MARWCEVQEQAPELVGRARALLDAGRHKTLATLRRDGSPVRGVHLVERR